MKSYFRIRISVLTWISYFYSKMVWVCCVTRQWTLHNECIPPMHWCLTVMREFYGEEKTDMEWKSSSSSKSAAPKPRWVAHCLDSFTEQWQESSVPQLIH